MSAKRVTLKEIAEATGFSSNTVSRALRNQSVISEETRRIINEKALEIGYVPNRAASILRSGESGLIALIVETLLNPFFGAVFEYLDRAASKCGYTVIVFSSHNSKEGEIAAIRNAYSQNVDGILLISCDESGDTIKLMKKLAIPHVLLFRDIPSAKCSFVLQDEIEGGKLAADYLLKLGCTNFVYCDSSWKCQSISYRKQGFVSQLKARGVDSGKILVLQSADNMSGMEESVVNAAADTLRKTSPSEKMGICTFCDYVAYGLMNRMEKAAGEDERRICYVSFDNIDDLMMSARQVSSIGADFQSMCRFAVTSLDEIIKGESTEFFRKTFPVELKTR